jgi:DNA-binding GntR family transcriptional regulator
VTAVKDRWQTTHVLDHALRTRQDRRTLAASVTEQLRQLILDGQLPAGIPLRPNQLAARLGVSVMPVREALRLLEAEGLVNFTPRRGARVAELDEEDIEELYLVRGALEGLAARLAVHNMRAEDLRKLRASYERMRRHYDAGQLDRFIREDRQFHELMYRQSCRDQLVKKILDLWDSGRRILALTYKTRAPMEAALASHAAILAACEARDAVSAERVTREHTEQAAARILAALHDEPASPSEAERHE